MPSLGLRGPDLCKGFLAHLHLLGLQVLSCVLGWAVYAWELGPPSRNEQVPSGPTAFQGWLLLEESARLENPFSTSLVRVCACTTQGKWGKASLDTDSSGAETKETGGFMGLSLVSPVFLAVDLRHSLAC